MPDFNSAFRFWRELRRRRVLHAAGLYLAGAWLILQVIDVIHEPMGMAGWFLSLLVWLAIFGFPITLVISWRYDIDHDGFHRTRPAEPVATETLAIKPVDYLIIGLTVVFIVLVSASLIRIQITEIDPPLTDTLSPNSIAVLPFENLGGQTQDDYLGRGLAEDILHRLTLVEGLEVSSRTASFELDTGNMDMASIGRRLGARSLLEGSVRTDGNRIRIVAQLIDAESGYHIWSRIYDRQLEDLFGIYDEISAAVVGELQLTLAPGQGRVLTPPTTDMQAYDYFLQARSILQRSTQSENAANALHFFARAVERDPKFAQAWAGQCQAYLEWYYYKPDVEKIELATNSCLKAVELNPELAEGHAALGDLYLRTGRFPEAIEEYTAALESDKRNAMALRGKGEALAKLDRTEEAEDAMKRAIDLDPDDLISFSALGGLYFSLGRYADALEVYSSMASHPRAGPSAFNGQGAAYYLMGQFDKAAEAYRQVVAREPTAVAYSNIGTMYFYNGQYDDAAVMYREAITLAPENPVWWGNLADNLQEINGGAEEARLAYRKAADLAEEMLSANPEDAELLTNLAHYHARLGDDDRASRYLSLALLAAPNDVYAHYYAALVHLEAGRTQEAMEALRMAVDLGYPRVLLAPDPQFAELRSNETFLDLIAASKLGGKD